MLREVLEVRRRVLGEEHPDTLTSSNNLGTSLSDQGMYADAERIHRQVLGVNRRVLGDEHPGTLTSANALAQSLSHQGKHADAERIQREVLDASHIMRPGGYRARSIPIHCRAQSIWPPRSQAEPGTPRRSKCSRPH
jgi:hypothetical protein